MKKNIYGIKDRVTQDFHSISVFSSDLEMLRNFKAVLSKHEHDISLGLDVPPIFMDDLDIYYLGTIDSDLNINPCHDFICKLSDCSMRYDNISIRSTDE